MTSIGDIIKNMRSAYVVNPDISSCIVYNTRYEKYLNANLVNNYVYWDTTGWLSIPDKGIEILNELLVDECQPLLVDTSLEAMVPIIQLELEYILIVPCIHFKKKSTEVQLDFVNAFRFDEAE